VIANGRHITACTQPVTMGMVVESESEELNELRRSLVDMLFVEGNHYCMFCEKSGNCELQALAYRLSITAPKYPFLFPDREVDASQTLHNLGAISSDVELPIMRPLIGMDKMEITAWSKKIGAFATSILPYRDCCSIRSPKPILTARARDLLQYSVKMELDDAVREALDGVVKVEITGA
jgi:hypothetical protein